MTASTGVPLLCTSCIHAERHTILFFEGGKGYHKTGLTCVCGKHEPFVESQTFPRRDADCDAYAPNYGTLKSRLNMIEFRLNELTRERSE